MAQTVSVSLLKAKKDIIVEALNFYKTSMENMGVSGKKAQQKIDDIDELILASDAQISFNIDKRDYDSFEKKHGKPFPDFEEN